jgi:hypothetical protein
MNLEKFTKIITLLAYLVMVGCSGNQAINPDLPDEMSHAYSVVLNKQGGAHTARWEYKVTTTFTPDDGGSGIVDVQTLDGDSLYREIILNTSVNYTIQAIAQDVLDSITHVLLEKNIVIFADGKIKGERLVSVRSDLRSAFFAPTGSHTVIMLLRKSGSRAEYDTVEVKAVSGGELVNLHYPYMDASPDTVEQDAKIIVRGERFEFPDTTLYMGEMLNMKVVSSVDFQDSLIMHWYGPGHVNDKNFEWNALIGAKGGMTIQNELENPDIICENIDLGANVEISVGTGAVVLQTAAEADVSGRTLREYQLKVDSLNENNVVLYDLFDSAYVVSSANDTILRYKTRSVDRDAMNLTGMAHLFNVNEVFFISLVARDTIAEPKEFKLVTSLVRGDSATGKEILGKFAASGGKTYSPQTNYLVRAGF